MSTPLIEVRIRNVSEARAVHLCTWPATNLDALIPTVNAWGLCVSGSGDLAPTVCGQFVVTESAAFFELMYGDEE